MAKWAFYQNDFFLEENVCLPLNDLSIQRGYGVFDFFRLKQQTALFLPDHLERFYTSAAGMHLSVPFESEALIEITNRLTHLNQLPDSGVRITLTGGSSPDGFTSTYPSLVISQQTFTAAQVDWNNVTLKLKTISYQRQLAQYKTIDYLMAIWLRPTLLNEGFDEALYQYNGWLSECPRSNFFLVTSNGVLVTPNQTILPGITRKQVLQLAAKEMKIEERPIALSELAEAREAFITSTTRQILPVKMIDDKIFTSHTITKRLHQLFQKHVQMQA